MELHHIQQTLNKNTWTVLRNVTEQKKDKRKKSIEWWRELEDEGFLILSSVWGSHLTEPPLLRQYFCKPEIKPLIRIYSINIIIILIKPKVIRVIKKETYLVRACWLVSPLVSGSKRPFSKLTLETDFFNRFWPISVSFCRFSLVAMSTEDSVPLKVSSWIRR